MWFSPATLAGAAPVMGQRVHRGEAAAVLLSEGSRQAADLESDEYAVNVAEGVDLVLPPRVGLIRHPLASDEAIAPEGYRRRKVSGGQVGCVLDHVGAAPRAAVTHAIIPAAAYWTRRTTDPRVICP